MANWTQPMLNHRDCIHGSLARKCEICERDEEIHVLRHQLQGAVASLAVIRSALDDLDRAPHRAQALADLPDVIRAALPPTGGQ